MRNVVVSGAKRSVIIVGAKKGDEKKVFCWFGLSQDKKFEVGTIIADDINDAKRKLLLNKTGGHYTVKEINPEQEFETLGTYNHVRL